jgi:hypothetical protein
MWTVHWDQNASIPALNLIFGPAKPWEPYLKNNRICGVEVSELHRDMPGSYWSPQPYTEFSMSSCLRPSLQKDNEIFGLITGPKIPSLAPSAIGAQTNKQRNKSWDIEPYTQITFVRVWLVRGTPSSCPTPGQAMINDFSVTRYTDRKRDLVYRWSIIKQMMVMMMNDVRNTVFPFELLSRGQLNSYYRFVFSDYRTRRTCIYQIMF